MKIKWGCVWKNKAEVATCSRFVNDVLPDVPDVLHYSIYSISMNSSTLGHWDRTRYDFTLNDIGMLFYLHNKTFSSAIYIE